MPPPATTTLTQVRDIATRAALQWGVYDSGNSDHRTRLDYAIKAAGDEWLAETKSDQHVIEGLTLASNATEVDISVIAEEDMFSVPQVMRVELIEPETTPPLTLQSIGVDYATLADAISAGGNGLEAWDFGVRGMGDVVLGNFAVRGIATVHAFSTDHETLYFYPPSSVERDVKIHYWKPFITWTYGVADASGVTLNIPDIFIFEFAMHAVLRKFDTGAPDQKWTQANEVKYQSALRRAKRRMTGTVLDIPGYSYPTGA